MKKLVNVQEVEGEGLVGHRARASEERLLTRAEKAEADIVRAAVREFKRTSGETSDHQEAHGCDFDDCQLCQAVVRLLSERMVLGKKAKVVIRGCR